MKKILTVLLTVFLTMIGSAAYVNGETTDVHNHCVCGAVDCTENHEETGVTDWQAWNGDISVGTAENADTTAVYLYLENDVVLTDTLDITNVTVYLCLNGNALTIQKEGYPVVRVGNNQKFVLCDCKETGKITGVKGSAESDTSRFGAVNCKSGSNFVLYSGNISDNEIAKANGGGIYITGGTFTMHGGAVKNNKAPNGSGGAISAHNSKLYIYEGEITGNSAHNSGAVHLTGNTKATFYNAKVNHNSANNFGGAVHMEGTSFLELRGAEFGYNTAQNVGGAIYVNGSQTIYIVDGDIHDNTAVSGSGGGIYMCDGIINICGGSIRNNHCDSDKGNGGGMCLIDTYISRGSGSDPNYDDSIISYISNNTAGCRGGGIYISSSGHALSFYKKCEIKGNTAQKEGGGIYIRGTYMFLILEDTYITENTALKGGGVYLNNGNSGRELEIGAATKIIENTSSLDGKANNLYLAGTKMFQFRNTVNSSAKIGVSVNTIPTVDEPTGIVYTGSDTRSDGRDHTDLILPDNDDYIVFYEREMHRLMPKTYTVTFDPKNGEEVKSKKVARGSMLSGFDYPTRDGYTFDAWYADGSAYNFEKPINGDLTLTARWIQSDGTALTVTQSKIVVFRLDKPAVVFVASYDGKKLLDVKKKELTAEESEAYIGIFELGLNTENATKVTAFLWDVSDGNIRPLCEGAAADF